MSFNHFRQLDVAGLGYLGKVAYTVLEMSQGKQAMLILYVYTALHIKKTVKIKMNNFPHSFCFGNTDKCLDVIIIIFLNDEDCSKNNPVGSDDPVIVLKCEPIRATLWTYLIFNSIAVKSASLIMQGFHNMLKRRKIILKST